MDQLVRRWEMRVKLSGIDLTFFKWRRRRSLRRRRGRRRSLRCVL